MTDPQIWTLIGVFAASTFGMCGLISTMFLRVLRAEIGGLRSEMNGGFVALRSELKVDITVLRSDLTTKIELLDKDIQAITRHIFPD
jgi:hypothetical protein